MHAKSKNDNIFAIWKRFEVPRGQKPKAFLQFFKQNVENNYEGIIGSPWKHAFWNLRIQFRLLAQFNDPGPN